MFSQTSLKEEKIVLQSHMGFLDIWSDIEYQWVNRLFVMEQQTIAVYRNQEIQPESQIIVSYNIEIIQQLENGMRTMTIINEDDESTLYKIGVLNQDVFKQWLHAFTQLKKYNSKENMERGDDGRYQIFKGEYNPPNSQQQT